MNPITIDVLIEKLDPVENVSDDELDTISHYNNDTETDLQKKLKKLKVQQLRDLLQNHMDKATIRKKLKAELIKDIIDLKISFDPSL